MRTLTVIILLATVFLPTTARPAATTFTDGTFDDADWSLTTFVFRSTGGAISGGSVVASQQPDGNPGTMRQVTNNIAAAPSPSEYASTFGIHLRTGFTYDPSTQGPIGSIDYFEDARAISSGHLSGLAVRQNGRFYFTQTGVGNATTWGPIAQFGIVAGAFTEVTADGVVYGSTPDLSATGAPLELGFLRASSNGNGSSAYPVIAAIDNWRVRINPPCTTADECDDGDPCTADTCNAGACTYIGPIDCGLSLTKDDHDHKWTDGAVIPFEITITNVDTVPKPGVRLLEVVPADTTFLADQSTAGWTCADGPAAGALCTLDLGDLTPAESRTVAFTVQVATDTPSSWDVYNEVGFSVGTTDGVAAFASTAAAPVSGSSCLIPTLGYASSLRCAHDCSEAGSAACWSEYEHYLSDHGADTATLEATCCLATIISRVVCAEELFNCGDGVKQTREECDDGNIGNGDACDDNCTVPRCRNFVTDPGEECDDGPAGTACCNPNCVIPPSAPASCAPATAAVRPALAGDDTPAPNPIDLRLLYVLRDGVFPSSVGGRRATQLYYQHAADLVRAALAEPGLIDLGRTALAAWADAIAALVQGDGTTVSEAQIDAITAFLDAARPVASPILAAAIDRGRQRLAIEGWPGISTTDALARLDALVCTAEATYGSVSCRLGDLDLLLVEATTPGRVADRLTKQLAKAISGAARATTLANDGKRRPARGALRAVAKRLGAMDALVRSRRGSRELGETIVADLRTLFAALRTDVKRLRQGIVPVEAGGAVAHATQRSLRSHSSRASAASFAIGNGSRTCAWS